MLNAPGAPDVSVVVPTHGRGEMLRRAVRSCAAAGAGAVEVEVVVSVDGEPPEYAADLENSAGRVVVLRSGSPGGRGRARNRGLVAATGEFVKFLDDDDWLEAGALAEEVAASRAVGADVVASGHFSVGEGVPPVYSPPPPFADGVDAILRGESVPTAAALYRRAALGGQQWDESAAKLDDWQFFVRAALATERVVRLDRPVYTWFQHPGQWTRQASRLEHAREFYWVLDEMERLLAESGRLTEPRRRRLAQYRYKELRTLARHDRAGFEREVERIRSLDPRFAPVDEERRRTIRWLARWIGFRRATQLWVAVGKLLGRA